MTQTQFSWYLLLYLLFLIYPELFPIWKCWRTTYITLVIKCCHPEVKACTVFLTVPYQSGEGAWVRTLETGGSSGIQKTQYLFVWETLVWLAPEFSFSGNFNEDERIYLIWVRKRSIIACKGIGIISGDVFKVHVSETLRPENNYLTTLLAFLSQVFTKLLAKQLLFDLYLKWLSRRHKAKLPDWQDW